MVYKTPLCFFVDSSWRACEVSIITSHCDLRTETQRISEAQSCTETHRNALDPHRWLWVWCSFHQHGADMQDYSASAKSYDWLREHSLGSSLFMCKQSWYFNIPSIFKFQESFIYASINWEMGNRRKGGFISWSPGRLVNFLPGQSHVIPWRKAHPFL